MEAVALQVPVQVPVVPVVQPTPVSPAVPAVRVEEANDRAAFERLRDEWNALVQQTDGSYFYRHEFISSWLDGFGAQGRLRVLISRGEDGRLQGVLPLVERKTRSFGLPVVQVSSASNAHSCRFDLVSRDPALVGRAFMQHLMADPGWDILRLVDVPEGGQAWGIQQEAEAAGLPTGTWASNRSPYLSLPSTTQALDLQLGSRFRGSLRRRRKRLGEKGEVQVERFTGGPELPQRLAEGLAVEQSGWKGRQGTAISQQEETSRFYAQLAERASHGGQLSLYFLRVNGQAVAFDFGLRHGGRYLSLKAGYDEAFRECSPGQLLTDQMLRDCVAAQDREFDFLGDDSASKRDWTQQLRPHAWLYVFRNSRKGRLLRAAKFRWAPAAKGLFKRWSK